MSRRKNPEQQIHRAVAQHLRTRAVPGLVWWHTPNGGSRGKIEGAILKSMGVRAGVSDFIFVLNGKIFALELKAEGGRASVEQLRFLSDIVEELDAAAAAGMHTTQIARAPSICPAAGTHGCVGDFDAVST